jgi:hypothetical protein
MHSPKNIANLVKKSIFWGLEIDCLKGKESENWLTKTALAVRRALFVLVFCCVWLKDQVKMCTMTTLSSFALLLKIIQILSKNLCLGGKTMLPNSQKLSKLENFPQNYKNIYFELQSPI